MTRTWHLSATWMDFDPATSSDPLDGEPREAFFAVEAADLDAALARGREMYPHAVIDLEWVAWEPWPGLVYRVSDGLPWEVVIDSPWTFNGGSILLRDAAPLPPGLERESGRVGPETIKGLLNQDHRYQQGHEHDRGYRDIGWRVEGEAGDWWAVHPAHAAEQPKSLDDDHAAALLHPRVRQIVAGPHWAAPLLGLDEDGQVVAVVIGRKA